MLKLSAFMTSLFQGYVFDAIECFSKCNMMERSQSSLSIFGYTINKSKLSPEQITLLELVWITYNKANVYCTVCANLLAAS